MWRDKNWDAVSIAKAAKFRAGNSMFTDMVEAGADAMHEADVKWLGECSEVVDSIPEAGQRGAPYRVISERDWQRFIGE